MDGTMHQFQSKSEKRLVIHVSNLKKSYGETVILKGVSIHVEEGAIYGLIGSSGCGKTSLLSCILNILPWDSGEICVLGKMNRKGKCIDPKDIGYMPQDIALYGRVKVDETLSYFARVYDLKSDKMKERFQRLQDIMDLSKLMGRRVDSLSGGQKRRVSMAIALLHQPKILVLDEPTAGLDPLLRERVWDYLVELSQIVKTSIIITTHYVEELRRADMIGIMRNGVILAEISPQFLIAASGSEILDDAVLKICQSQETNMITATSPYALTENDAINQNLKTLEWSRFSKEGNTKFTDAIQKSLRRTMAFTWLTLINYLRYPLFAIFVIFLPAFQLYIGGAVLEGVVKFTPVGVVNLEIPEWKTDCAEFQNDIHANGSQIMGIQDCNVYNLSCTYIKYLFDKEVIDPVPYHSEEEAKLGVVAGTIKGFMVIPANYSQYFAERVMSNRFATNESIDGTTIAFKNWDMGEFVRILMTAWKVQLSFTEFLNDLATKCNFGSGIGPNPLLFKEPVYGKFEDTAGTYAIPQFAHGALFMTVFVLAPYVIIQEFKDGTLSRSKIAGLRYAEFITGVVLLNAFATFLAAIVSYVTLWYGLDFEVHGTFIDFLILSFIGGLCSSMFGVFFGLLLNDVLGVIIMAILLVPDLMLFTGVYRPEVVMSAEAQFAVRYFFPTASIVKSYRWVMNQGVGLLHPQVWPGILITMVWSAVFMIISAILQLVIPKF